MLFKNGGKHVYINWVAEKILSGFIVVAACVMTFEARDSAAKSYLQRTHKPLTHMNTGGSSIHRHKVSPNRTDSSRRHTGQGNPSEFTFFYIFQIFYPLKALKKNLPKWLVSTTGTVYLLLVYLLRISCLWAHLGMTPITMRFFFEIDRRMALHVSQLLNRPAAKKNLDTVSTVQCPLGNT